MTTLERISDIVIYDGPPVLAVADALEFAPRVGMSVLVVDAGNTGRHALSQAATRLSAVNAELGGVLLNRATSQDSYYGYSYYASYTEEATAPDGRRWARRKDRADDRGRSPGVFTARRPPVPNVRSAGTDDLWDEPQPSADPTPDLTPDPTPEPDVSTSDPSPVAEPAPEPDSSPDPVATWQRTDAGDGSSEQDASTAPEQPPWEGPERDLDEAPTFRR